MSKKLNPNHRTNMNINIILAGVGGQGILTIANVLGMAALEQGLYLKQAEVHGMSQRGGDVQSNLRISSDPIHSDLIPLGGADIIISMEPMEALRYLPYLRPGGAVVTNTNPFVNIPDYPAQEVLEEAYSGLSCRCVRIDADAIAKEAASPRSANIVLLGAAAPFIGMETALIEDAVAKRFSAKGTAVADANLKAFRLGLDFTRNQ